MGAVCCAGNDNEGQMADLPLRKVLEERDGPDEADEGDVERCADDDKAVDGADEAENKQPEDELANAAPPPGDAVEVPEAVQEPEAEEAANGKVKLEFKAGDSVEIIELSESPHGMTFGATAVSDSEPMVVTSIDPDSSGAEAGVKDGWTLSKVNGHTATLDIFTKQVAMLQEAKGKGAASPLIFGFETADGDKKVLIEFTKGPFGMQILQNKMPLQLTRTVDGGEAEKLGVQGGWRITSIGGRSLAKYDYTKAMDFVKAGASFLEKENKASQQ
jgi:hypothetical protein